MYLNIKYIKRIEKTKKIKLKKMLGKEVNLAFYNCEKYSGRMKAKERHELKVN